MKTCDIAKVVNEKVHGSPHGICAVFVALNDRWGIKMFDYEYKRDEVYGRQKSAAKHGLGPDVGGKIDLHDGDYNYGYITEKVETLIDTSTSMMSDNFDWDEYDKAKDEYEDELGRLKEELEEIGLTFEDNHPANVGWKNGRLVCIDFGED